ncbi:hypothetical protein BKA69DRAFT_1121163 [Paraphysoderma sedebokerense]|nr:hypothetical protein BKA69DRAFT_1121163 [Paraphysoderma sedebokerense]
MQSALSNILALASALPSRLFKKSPLVSVLALLYIAWVRRKHNLHRQKVKALVDAGFHSYSPTVLDFVEQINSILYPHLTEFSLQLGFFKTYTIPSISKLLVATGQFKKDPLKRVEDTELIIREFTERSHCTPRGSKAIERLNEIHGRYDIKNEDYLYVLGIFMSEPVRFQKWLADIEFEKELKIAQHLYWSEIGGKMGIKDIPKSYEEMVTYMKDFESRNQTFHPANQKVTYDNINGVLNKVLPFPFLLTPLYRTIVLAFLSKRDCQALNHPYRPILRFFLSLFVKSTNKLIKLLVPPRSEPLKRTPVSNVENQPGLYIPTYHVLTRMYAKGYRIEDLGPQFESKCPMGHKAE